MAAEIPAKYSDIKSGLETPFKMLFTHANLSEVSLLILLLKLHTSEPKH